jgi:hypothetical protein
MALTAVLFVLGPWPVDDSSFEGSDYQVRTLDRLEIGPNVTSAEPIRVGLAEVDLTPSSPRPLAGFIGQVRTPFVGIDSPCLARALTVESGSERLTILTADLLLINTKLARATCERAGVPLDQVYFTSSHTHGGPGGWGDHPLERLVAGAYDPAYFNELANRLADIVRRSRAKLEPAELGFVQVQAKGRQTNRVVRGSTTHDALSALVFRPIAAQAGTNPISARDSSLNGSNPISGRDPSLDGSNPIPLVPTQERGNEEREDLATCVGWVERSEPHHPDSGGARFTRPTLRMSPRSRVFRADPFIDGTNPITAQAGTKPIAILVVFGAHATVSHPVPPRLGADYPAAVVSELRRRTGARSVLFAAGAVGDASPTRPKAASQAASAEVLGSALADDLMTALPFARFETNPIVGNLRLAVDLPTVRLPFLSRWLRFSPLATWWIADRQTHLHAIRLGPAVLVGFPGDYSGHLADRLVDSTRSDGVSAVATSFDGDYRGYLVSSQVFRDHPCYETRWMNFYGPGAGEYLNDLARRMVDRLTDFPGKLVRPDRSNGDLAPRLALASLLVLGGKRLVGMVGRAGWLTVGIASAALLAFVVAPTTVDWAKVGLPTWVRLVGVVPAAYGLRIARDRPARAALLVGSGFGLLTASWVVVLMIARGSARWGLSDRPKAARSASSAS